MADWQPSPLGRHPRSGKQNLCLFGYGRPLDVNATVISRRAIFQRARLGADGAVDAWMDGIRASYVDHAGQCEVPQTAEST